MMVTLSLASKLLFLGLALCLFPSALTLNCSVTVKNIICICKGKIQCNSTNASSIEMISTVNGILATTSNTSENEVDIKVPNLNLTTSDAIFKNTNIKKLIITNSNLSEISENALNNLKNNLLYLNLKENNFTSIPSKSLRFFKLLQSLVISKNFIQKINITDFFYNENLTYLDLSYNRISFIEIRSFVKLQNLTVLNLEANNISSVHKNIFKGLDNLKTLFLSKNKLKDLPEDLLDHMSRLNNFIADGNKLISFSNIKIISSSLISLHLTDCYLNESLNANMLKGLLKLESLHLNHNPIKYISKFAFSKFLELSFLDLDDCQLNHIDKTAFHNLTNLQDLHLEKNNLTQIECQHTIDLQSLETINLEDNQLEKIENGTFALCPNLNEINLNGNKLNCNCDLAGFAEFLNNIADDDMKEDIECYFPLEYQNTPVISFNFDSLNCTKNESSCIKSDQINVKSVSSPKFNIQVIKIDYKIDDTMDIFWSIQKIGYSPDGIFECNVSYSVIDEDDFLDLPIKDCISSNNDPKNNSLNLQLQGEEKYTVCIRIIYINNDSVYEEHCLTADYIKPTTLDPFLLVKTSPPQSSSKITLPSNTSIFLVTDDTNSTLSNNTYETNMTTITDIIFSSTHDTNSTNSTLSNNTYETNMTTITDIIFSSTLKLTTNKTIQTITDASKDNLTTSTISSNEYSSVSIQDFILISINENQNNKPYLFWNLSIEEVSNFCKLQISITLYENTIRTERQKCINGSLYLGNLESKNDYKLCISKFYNFTKNQNKCTYFKISPAFASTESHNNGNIKFPIAALVGLLLLALLILIVIVVVLIKLILMKRTRSNQYNVSKEEEEISSKRKSNTYSINAMPNDTTV